MSETPPPHLFGLGNWAPPSWSGHFDGPEYDAGADVARLTGQLREIWGLMNDGKWRTVNHIASITNFPANSVQAQLRNLRKPRFGAYLVDTRRVIDSGLYEYRVGGKGAGRPATVSCLNCARLERIIVELMKEINQ